MYRDSIGFSLLKLAIRQIVQNLIVWLLLHRDDGFVSSRVERLHVVILHFALQNLIEVQNRLVCVADLEILTDHPCGLHSHEKAILFLCSFFFGYDDLFLSLRS